MLEFLQSLLLAVVTAAVPVLTTFGVSALKSLAEKKAAETEDVRLRGYLQEIAGAVSDAVAATSQTYVDELKKAGSFDLVAHNSAADQALVACLRALSPAVKGFIEEAYGDVRAYLGGKIEAEVRAQKDGSVRALGEAAQMGK